MTASDLRATIDKVHQVSHNDQLRRSASTSRAVNPDLADPKLRKAMLPALNKEGYEVSKPKDKPSHATAAAEPPKQQPPTPKAAAQPAGAPVANSARTAGAPGTSRAPASSSTPRCTTLSRRTTRWSV
jgi:hypothetical protein